MKFLLRMCGSRPAVIIFLMTFVAYSYFFHRFRFWGVNSRLALTYAIVDKGTLRIDDYVNHPWYETQDRAYYHGHYFSDKIIGLSLLAVPVYWGIERAAGLVGKDPKPDLSRYGITVATVSLPAALLAVVLLRILTLLGLPPPTSCAVVLFFAFGTILFPFSSLFYAYLPSLFFLMTVLYLMLRWQEADTPKEEKPWLAGLLVGLALICEYTLAVPAALVSFGYLIHLKGRRLAVLSFCGTMAIPLLIFAAYNFSCFGNPFSLPYAHLEHPEFAEGMGQGLMGVHRFQWYVLYLITISPYRGIFFYSPFLLLGFPGIWAGIRQPIAHHRWLAWMVLAIVIYYFVLNASYYMWWGGGTLLARHLVPMLPFLAVAFAWMPLRLRPVLMVLGFVSIILIGSQSVVEPHFRPLEPDTDLYIPWETVQRTGHALVPPFLWHSIPELLHGRISMNLFNRSINATDGKTWTLLPLLLAEASLFALLRRTLRKHEGSPAIVSATAQKNSEG